MNVSLFVKQSKTQKPREPIFVLNQNSLFSNSLGKESF